MLLIKIDDFGISGFKHNLSLANKSQNQKATNNLRNIPAGMQNKQTISTLFANMS